MLHTYTLAALRDGLTRGDFSSRELTQHFLTRIQQFDGQLNSFITVCADNALVQADAADIARANGSAHALAGIPLAQKDIFCTKGVKTSCGSKMLDNFISPYNAHVISQCEGAGLVMLGKTNMDEFAMGSSNETSFYGAVKNPWDISKVAGGSSGGSAAAVAARLAPAATGTDTGGSIRQPAALCNLTGLKPTYGRVSRWGMIAYASSLDQAGPMTQTAEDAALLLNVMAGYDEKDSTCINTSVPDYSASLNNDIKGLRIGIPKQYFGEGLDADVAAVIQQSLKELEKLGAILVDIDLPNTGLSVPAYYVIAPAEASSNLSRFDGARFGYRCDNPKDLTDLYKRSRAEGFGSEVKRRIMIGTYALSAGYYDAYYLQAQKVRRLVQQDFVKAFEKCDVIAGPTSPSVAFGVGEKNTNPIAMYLSDIYTIATNLAGLPAMSIPAGFSQNLPVGLQLVGNYWQEAQLLNVAHRYQQVTAWHSQLPIQFA
ncbi:MAG: Asp-tRNA(Asn)/Glu-tRNA(Gln) amidotransferase subunit GatA [Agitococcus sp.]|nr:Asp-tRNA(Asn)/Glu-tRNA(Gln) amidotransferase subunit GatA [Agitococcus sp.]MDO9180497.1 Asp-tRNA(Asn)/Glu-tRNA(Gln) amidotransferase subunit GatA [Agitococcus sp.]